MPAINVARTDTFEVQRQKINQIGDQIFSISQGGSDLATGNLKLGDGSRLSPSLAFIDESTLGLYRPDVNTIGFVSNEEKVFDVSNASFINYKDFTIRQNILSDAGISLSSSGSNYDAGSFTEVPLLGGTGSGATVDITVDAFTGSITNNGSGYTPGGYINIDLLGGNGSGATGSFTVDGLDLSIGDVGSLYRPGYYYNVPLVTVTGSGTNALATVNITGGANLSLSTTNPGSGYSDAVYSNVKLLNSPASTFTVTYSGGDYSINGSVLAPISAVIGNTYRFDLSDSSLLGEEFILQTSTGQSLNSNYVVTTEGQQGTTGAYLELIILPSATTDSLRYISNLDASNTANITVSTGASGQYGYGATADITVTSGSISNVTLINNGAEYNVADVLVPSPVSLLSGVGAAITVSNIVYSGEVSSIVVTDVGQDYANGDEVTFNDSDVGSGGGSGFTATITSDPGVITSFNFVNQGTGYQANDNLSLPTNTTVNVTLDVANDVITLADTSTIVIGSEVVVNSGTGTLAPGTTVLNKSATDVTLSSFPTGNGSANISFVVAYGEGTTSFGYQIASLGGVSSVTINESGIGYSDFDVLSVNPFDLVAPITYSVDAIDTQTLTFTGTFSSSAFAVGDTVKIADGNVQSADISSSTTIDPNGSYIDVTPSGTSGNGVGATFDFSRDGSGNLLQAITNSGGLNYSVGDTITINGSDVGGSSPTDDVTLTVSGVGLNTEVEVKEVKSSGGNISYIVVENNSFLSGNVIIRNNSFAQTFTLDTVADESRFLIDTGSGYTLNPNLTFFSGNTYQFDYSLANTASNQTFAFSKYADGPFSPSLIESVSTTVTATSATISVADTSNIFEGMTVVVESGTGAIPEATTVQSIDSSTQLTLSNIATISGPLTLTFRGNEYTEGVSRDGTVLSIKVTDNTPSLYYYSTNYENVGGADGDEATVTVDLNNPKVFGSGFTLLVSSVDSTDIINFNVDDGNVSSVSLNSTTGTFTDVSVASTLSSPTITSTTLSVSNINSSGTLSISPSTEFSNSVTVGSISLDSSNGNIQSPGSVSAITGFNSNDKLLIVDNTISTTTGNQLTLTPAIGEVVKVSTNTAITIPSGTTQQRPSSAENGSIRFNTNTGQYEGYSAGTSSWSSLGGVRDLDGNTYIAAEEFIGANDNRLWFYNDGVNTVRFTRNYQEFLSAKKVRSLNTSAPSYTDWISNSPVSNGQYLKYGHSIYEVTISGTTASVGNEPTDTSGNPFTNGTATLQYYTTAVAALTFEEISELRIGPSVSVPVVIGGDLRLKENNISTDVSDILLTPNTGKKVKVSASTSLVIPVGTSSGRGAAEAGSIRYNTTISQYEGYNGTNWSSLGGVRDVDGNTYIIPETTPGANENILYFYNDGSNTLKLSDQNLTFVSVDTIESDTEELNLNADVITFADLGTTLDNSTTTTSFLFSSKDNLDLGLSSGINNDALLRLTNTGDIFFNLGYGTGTEDVVKLYDNNLQSFELKDVKTTTSSLELEKGLINSGNTILFDPSTELSSGTKIVVFNTTTGDKEIINYDITSKGSDIFYNDYGNVKTGASLITTTFDFDPSGNVRLNIVLDSQLTAGDVVNITTLNTVTKK